MAEAQTGVKHAESLEGDIMDMRRRIDSDVETLNGSLRRAMDWRSMLLRYAQGFTAAAFMAGFVFTAGGRRRPGAGRRAPKKAQPQSPLNLGFVLRTVQPALQKMLVDKVSSSKCPHREAHPTEEQPSPTN
ncbi:MAG: hypothetical protein ACYC1U_09330 [Candidatus Aquicultorales bacterium]